MKMPDLALVNHRDVGTIGSATRRRVIAGDREQEDHGASKSIHQF